MAERNVKLIIEYDGTAYAGWQIQAGERTVQGEIAKAIGKVTGREVNLIGAGRTDTGVHALGQVANFVIDHRLPPDKYRDAINHYVDDDIVILRSEEAPPDFHARYSARRRRYRYLVGRQRSALHRHRRWAYERELDVGRLKQAAAAVRGEHDFRPFCVSTSQKEDNRCTIDYSHWFDLPTMLVYEIRGNRFLHHMVRGLVGAMINLATVEPDKNKHNLTLVSFIDIIQNATAERIVFTAPATGLYLVSVGYDEGKA